MINKILDLVKDSIKRVVEEDVNIPAEKREQVIDVTSATLSKGLKDNASSLIQLFSSENTSIIDGLKNSIVNSLAEKVELNKDTSTQIASSLMPVVMGVLNETMVARKPLSLDSLAGVVTGFSSKNTKKGGLLNTITKFLKK